ncbi:MAG: hypothetical protein JXA67_07390 [Micromonosporaceae bacterium]|nr:hypothetical protein [Micromonosporaceae bacterium]
MTTTDTIAVSRDFVEREHSWLVEAERSIDSFNDETPLFSAVTIDDGNDCFGLRLKDMFDNLRGKINEALASQQSAIGNLSWALRDMLATWDSVEEENKKMADFYGWYVSGTKPDTTDSE